MLKVIGVLIVISGWCFALYVGGYVMLYTGIVDIIGQIRAEVITDSILAWAIVKVIAASFVGGLIGMFASAIGGSIIELD